MPFYRLICRDCGHRFEQRASISQRAEIICPACGSRRCETDYAAGSAHVQVRKNGASGACPHSGTCGCHCARRS